MEEQSFGSRDPAVGSGGWAGLFLESVWLKQDQAEKQREFSDWKLCGPQKEFKCVAPEGG